MGMSFNTHYVIFDLEATCWDTRDPNCTELEKYKQENEMETIEIGAVKTTSDFRILDKFTVFCKPRLNPVLSDFCKNLTTITQKDVDTSKEFRSGYKQFLQWSENPTLFVAWGAYDGLQLQKDCLEHCTRYFGHDRYLNAKELMRALRGFKGHGLGKEVRRYNLSFEGTQHRGIDDSIMVAKVMRSAKLEREALEKHSVLSKIKKRIKEIDKQKIKAMLGYGRTENLQGQVDGLTEALLMLQEED